MSSKTTIYISPSRNKAYQACDRLGFGSYIFNGNGISREGDGPLYFNVGHAVHGGCKLLWQGQGLDEALASIPDHFVDVKPETFKERTALQEAMDLSTALVYVWYKFRYDTLITQYEPILFEQPMEVTLFEDEQVVIKLYTILDALLRERDTGNLMAWELKTTKTVNDKWAKAWDHDIQIVLEHVAAESLRDALGLEAPVSGVMVEALLKGSQRSYKDGITRHATSLIWPYTRASPTKSTEVSYKYKNWREGWSRSALASSCMKGGLMGWLESLNDEQLIEHTRTVDPIRLPAQERESFLRQIVASARREHQAVLGLPKDESSDEYWSYVDEHWAQSTKSCHYPWDCAMLDFCWSSGVRADPLGSGIYKARKSIEERIKEQAE